MPEPSIELSVIVPVVERYDDVEEVYRLYRSALEDSGRPFEIIYVVDGDFDEVVVALERLIADGERIKVIKLARRFGEGECNGFLAFDQQIINREHRDIHPRLAARESNRSREI